jgi:hypothetical protein
MSAMSDIVKSAKEDDRYKALSKSTPDMADADGTEEEGDDKGKSSPEECYGRAFDALKGGDRAGFVSAMQEAESDEEE